jgi:hypothetical protein
VFQRWVRVSFCVLTLLTTACLQVRAQTFQVTTHNLGGGKFDYNILVYNTGGSEPLKGVILYNASSTFSLDSNSEVDAPAGWDFQWPPVPPVVDQIPYFSISPAADTPIGGTQGGFDFESGVNPSTVSPSDFHVDGVGRNTGHNITLTQVPPVPEGSSPLSFGAGVLAVLSCLRRHRKRAV